MAVLNQKGKNLIICCDGTSNQLGETYSNVVKIYSVMKVIPDTQQIFYDPGVGTLSYPNALFPAWRKFRKIVAQAVGGGLETNVSEAYSYLMENYEPGDRIYLFGFSRGAYTVKVLAGLIKVMGLLQKGCQNLIPYAWDSYKECFKENVKAIAGQFKASFSRDVRIEFMGIWDTVSSVGFIKWKTYPFTAHNDNVKIIRHAISIDERRRFFRQNLFGPSVGQDIRQVWFAGDHCDIGGSHPLNESGLSLLSLEWMINEAFLAGINIDEDKVQEVVYDGLAKGTGVPDHAGMIHPSPAGMWWIPEIFLKKKRKSWMYFIPLGESRHMYRDFNNDPITPKIHKSVEKRMAVVALKYAPKNLLTPKEKFEVDDPLLASFLKQKEK